MAKRMPHLSPLLKLQEEENWGRFYRSFEGVQGFDGVALDRAAKALRGAVEEVTKRLESVVRQTPQRTLALCPYHADHNVGSFMMNARTGWFRCWSCGSRGGVFQLMETLGLSSTSLKQELRDVDLRVLSDFIEGRDPHDEDSHFVIPEPILANYDRRPLRLIEKGHSRGLIDAYEIGYDEKRARITFPVRRATGELVAIQTRAVCPNDPIRWKFYRQEIIHDLGEEAAAAAGLQDYVPPRRSIFFNAHNVLSELVAGSIRKPVVLCEGPGHALRCIAAGYPAIASFGVALAEQQKKDLVEALYRIYMPRDEVPRLIIATDGDRAGRISAFDTCLDLPPEFDVRIADIPEGMDPEDLDVRDLRIRLGSAPKFSYYTRGRTAEWVQEALYQRHLKKVAAEARIFRHDAWQKRRRRSHKNAERLRKSAHPLQCLRPLRGHTHE